MAKTRAHIDSIVEQCTGKVPSDDTRLEDLFVLHQMNTVRQVLIKEAFDSGVVDEGFYQLKCCIPIECDRIICNGLDSGEKIFFSNLPKLVEGIGWSNITYFGNVEFAKHRRGLHNKWDRYTFSGFLSVEYQEWSLNRPAYTIIGGYKAGSTEIDGTVALLKNLPNTGARSLCVNGIFANPEEGLCDEETVYDIEYPIPGHLAYKLELIVIKQILSTEVTKGDESNDARDNTTNSNNTGVKMNDPKDYGGQQ